MKIVRNSLVATILVLLFFSSPGSAHHSTWAKRGTSFPASCFSDSLKACRPLRILSPDRQKFVEVLYRKLPLDDGDFVMVVALRVVGKEGVTTEVGSAGLVEQEILWSLDSSSFLINGSDGGEGPDYVSVYRLGDRDTRPLDVTAVQRDMVKSFPPCKAKDADPKDCTLLTEQPEYINVSAVDWTRASSAVVVMAEMPCSSRFGGIMCEVLGYEVEASTGKILKRMEAREFAKRWQHSMAWKFHMPDPPEYETKWTSAPM